QPPTLNLVPYTTLFRSSGELGVDAADEIDATETTQDKNTDTLDSESIVRIPERKRFSLQRLLSYSLRESLELRRDPVRLMMALLGSVLLMLVMGYGINMDVEDLQYAVYDLDQSTVSQNYNLNIAGSAYFNEQVPI